MSEFKVGQIVESHGRTDHWNGAKLKIEKFEMGFAFGRLIEPFGDKPVGTGVGFLEDQIRPITPSKPKLEEDCWREGQRIKHKDYNDTYIVLNVWPEYFGRAFLNLRHESTDTIVENQCVGDHWKIVHAPSAAPEAKIEKPVLQHGDWKAGDIAFDRSGHEMRLICWERNSCGHEAWRVEDNEGSGTWCHEFEKNLKRRDEVLYALDGLTPTDRRLRDERVKRVQQERIAANEHEARLFNLSRIERALSEVGELRGYGADYMALTGCQRIEE